MSQQAFLPMGNTQIITANVTAPTGVLISAAGNNSCSAYRVGNPEANETIFYAFGLTAAAARVGANISAQGPWVPLPAGGVEVVRGPAGAYFSGATRTAAANLYVTPGEGM